MKLFNLPNIFTCCNLISGCIATYFAINGEPGTAMLLIIIGAVFDFLDGFSARLIHVSSPIGKELDSLADVVTFGVAPSAIVGKLLSSFHPILGAAAFIMAAFSALRLAKFNLDTRQTTSFIGLPTPANALFWASLVYGYEQWITAQGQWAMIAVFVLLLVMSYLLISEIPMFALKFKQYKWKGNEIKYIFLICALILIIILKERAFAFAIALYILMSVFNNSKNQL